MVCHSKSAFYRSFLFRKEGCRSLSSSQAEADKINVDWRLAWASVSWEVLLCPMSNSQPKISRQRLWQLRRRKAGLCTRCGAKPLHTKNHCVDCAKLQREYMRQKTNAKVRYFVTASYQKPLSGKA
jgi:hypothetical protein